MSIVCENRENHENRITDQLTIEDVQKMVNDTNCMLKVAKQQGKTIQVKHMKVCEAPENPTYDANDARGAQIVWLGKQYENVWKGKLVLIQGICGYPKFSSFLSANEIGVTEEMRSHLNLEPGIFVKINIY